jgi:hypothetical protein
MKPEIVGGGSSGIEENNEGRRRRSGRSQAEFAQEAATSQLAPLALLPAPRSDRRQPQAEDSQ